MPTLFKRATCMAPAVLGLLMAGCSGDFNPLTTASVAPAIETNTNKFVPGVPKGYQCPLVPNGFDPVGSIYRLDKDGTYYRVKDFSGTPEITALGNFKRDVKISNYQLTDTQQASAGLSFELLQKVVPGLAASATADYKKGMTVDITAEDMVGEVIDDVVADLIVELFETTMTPKAGSRYFLVREAVKAGAVSYRLKHADLARVGGKAELENLAKTAANVTVREMDGVVEVKQVFKPERMPVCIKPAEITIQARHDRTASANLKRSEETPLPKIKRVGVN